jgi:hypothetical protein
MNLPSLARRYLPILDCGGKYTIKAFSNDLINVVWSHHGGSFSVFRATHHTGK